MAMGMIRKPLVSMDKKYIRDQATPDFVSFQDLFRKAEDDADSTVVPLQSDTTEFDALSEERRKDLQATFHENEFTKLLQLPVRTILPYRQDIPEVRLVKFVQDTGRSGGRKRPHSAGDQPDLVSNSNSSSLLFSNPSLKYASFYEPWETSICWDDVAAASPTSLASCSQRKVNKRLRRIIPQNSAVAVGQWVNGIVWDDSVVEVQEGESLLNQGKGMGKEGRWLSVDAFSRLVDTSSSSRPIDVVTGAGMCMGRDNYSGSDNDSDSDTENLYIREIHELEDAYAFLKPGAGARRTEVETEGDKDLDSKDALESSKGNGTSTDAISRRPAPLPLRLTKQQKLEQLERDKTKRLLSIKLFNQKGGVSSNDTSDSSRAGTAARRKRTTAAEEELEHSSFAARHFNTTAALTHLQLKFFHRPTLSRQALSSVLHKKPNIWHIQVEKRGKHKLTASQGNLRRTQNSTKQISSAAELSLTDDTSEYICIEYIEEFPNLIMNRGMASKMINYFRPVESQETFMEGDGDGEEGGGSSDLKSGATSLSKEGTTLSGVRTGGMNRRVPRHMQRLKSGSLSGTAFNVQGIGGNGVGDIDIPKLKEGVTEVLEKGEDFPFLGEITPGAPPQPTLHCDLYRSPLFPHEPHPTDFLLVRKSAGGSGGGFQFVLKKLPTLFTSGQQEPLKDVPTPKKKKAITKFQINFMMFHITKYFETHTDIDLPGVQKEFKYFWENYKSDTKKALRRLADECVDPDDDTVTWIKKAALTPKQLQKMQMQNIPIPLGIDDYMQVFSPEDVCIYESGTSAEYRLSLLGINYFMTQKQLEQVLNRFGNVKKFKTNRLLKIKRQLRSVMKDQELKRFMPNKLNKLGEDGGVGGTQEEKDKDDEFSRQIKNLYRLKDIIEVELKRLKERINVTRYIYEISLLTPWVLTSSFVKNHLEEQNKNLNGMKAVLAGGVVGGSRGGFQKYSGLLRLTGIPGDPSGVGEGYSYLAAVSKKTTVVKKDKNDSSTSSTATIVGTGKDLRILSMKDLETLCLQLGTGRDEVKILERWDRVRVIQFAATEAKKLGYAKHLWRYAREEKEGTQNLEEYKQTCLEIWNRQVHALRDVTWADSEVVESEAREESLRRLKRKQRRERRAELRARLAARAEKQEKRASRARAREAGEEVEDSDGDKDEEKEEEDIDLVEESDSSSSDDSDSDSDSESDLNTDDDEDVENEDAAADAADEPLPVPAVASKRSKKAMALAKLNNPNTQEEKDLKFFENLSSESSSSASGGASSNGSTVVVPPKQKTREEHEQYWNELRQRGGKVVKRVTRRILEDGTEKIEVRFIVDEKDVGRVLEMERIAEVRERRLQRQREEDIAMGRSPRRNSRGGDADMLYQDSAAKKKKNRKSMIDHVGDNYEDEMGDESTSLTLKMGNYLNKAEKYTNRVARQRAQEEMLEEREYERYHKKSSINSRQVRGAGTYSQRSTVSQQRHLRLPHVLLAANLEIILCSIWNKKIAAPFRAPVNLIAYPDYTNFVKQPISLQEIRDNIVDYSYHTVEAFVNDLKLMVSNSRLYNGEQGPITQNAKKLCEEAIRRLAAEGGGYVDKDINAMGKDSYGFYGQENDIKTKFARIGRVFHLGDGGLLGQGHATLSAPDLPDVMHANSASGCSSVTSPPPEVDTRNLISRRPATSSTSSSTLSLSTAPDMTLKVPSARESTAEVEADEVISSSGTDIAVVGTSQQQQGDGLTPMSDGEEEEEEEEVLEEG